VRAAVLKAASIIAEPQPRVNTFSTQSLGFHPLILLDLCAGSMRLQDDLLRRLYYLLCPVGSSLKFAFYQWTFRAFHKEPFRRNHQFSSFFLESVGDGLGGIAEYLDEKRQDADSLYLAPRISGIKGSDFDTL
jgi:hypothetical protein